MLNDFIFFLIVAFYLNAVDCFVIRHKSLVTSQFSIHASSNGEELQEKRIAILGGSGYTGKEW